MGDNGSPAPEFETDDLAALPDHWSGAHRGQHFVSAGLEGASFARTTTARFGHRELWLAGPSHSPCSRTFRRTCSTDTSERGGPSWRPRRGPRSESSRPESESRPGSEPESRTRFPTEPLESPTRRRNVLSSHRISSCNTTDGRAAEVRSDSWGGHRSCLQEIYVAPLQRVLSLWPSPSPAQPRRALSASAEMLGSGWTIS